MAFAILIIFGLTVMHCIAAVWLARILSTGGRPLVADIFGWIIVGANLGAALMWGHQVIVVVTQIG